MFEGETSAVELVNQLSGKRDMSKVPNLIYRQNGKIMVNQPFYSENINELPAPELRWISTGSLPRAGNGPARSIFAGLLLQGSAPSARSTLHHQNFRQKDPGKTVYDLQMLSEKYHTPVLFLHR